MFSRPINTKPIYSFIKIAFCVFAISTALDIVEVCVSTWSATVVLLMFKHFCYSGLYILFIQDSGVIRPVIFASSSTAVITWYHGCICILTIPSSGVIWASGKSHDPHQSYPDPAISHVQSPLHNICKQYLSGWYRCWITKQNDYLNYKSQVNLVFFVV